MELALASGSNLLGDSELNDAFKAELPQGEEEEIASEEEPTEEETEEEDEPTDTDYDFDQEAGFQLISDENE